MILIFSQVPPPIHGSTKITSKLIEILELNSIKFRLINRNFSKNIDEVQKFRLSKILIFLGIFFNFLYTFALQNRTRRKDGEYSDLIIFFFTTSRYSFFVDAVFFEMSIFARRKVILYLHTSTEEIWKKKGFKEILFRRILRKSTKVIVLGKTLEKEILKNIPILNTEIIPNTISFSSDLDFNHKFRYSKDISPTFLFLSNLLPEKGLFDFIEFSRIFVDEHKSGKFKVVGEKTDKVYYESALRLVDQYNLTRFFDFLGFIDGEAKFKQLVSADYLIFPSRYYEAQPLTILESFSVGTPVIAYGSGGIPDIIINGLNGYVVDSNPESIMRAYKKIGKSIEEITLLRNSTKRSFDLYYGESTFENNWLKILNATLEQS